MKPFLILCCAAAIGAGCLACGKSNVGGVDSTATETAKKSSAQASSSPSTNPRLRQIKYGFSHEGSAEVQLTSQIKVISREFTEENAPLKFRVHVAFPQLQGALSPLQKRFNTIISALARKHFNEYKFGQLKPISTKRRFPRYHADVVEYLSINYDMPYASEDSLSIRFSAETYGRGAGHAVQYFFVLNYDLKSGRKITLTDLFSHSSGYRTFISNYSRERVKESLCAERDEPGAVSLTECMKNVITWDEGFKANDDNFDAWSITREGLLFSFDECQLAACAAGEFYVMVPYAEIKPLIKPDSVISEFLKSSS